MKHVFKATRMGWQGEKEGIWFDAEVFSKESAQEQFQPFQGMTEEGYDYTGYEYDGIKYHDVTYLGEFEDDKLPHCDMDLV